MTFQKSLYFIYSYKSCRMHHVYWKTRQKCVKLKYRYYNANTLLLININMNLEYLFYLYIITNILKYAEYNNIS